MSRRNLGNRFPRQSECRAGFDRLGVPVTDGAHGVVGGTAFVGELRQFSDGHDQLWGCANVA